jgi:hypothetical protein
VDKREGEREREDGEENEREGELELKRKRDGGRVSTNNDEERPPRGYKRELERFGKKGIK